MNSCDQVKLSGPCDADAMRKVGLDWGGKVIVVVAGAQQKFRTREPESLDSWLATP